MKFKFEDSFQKNPFDLAESNKKILRDLDEEALERIAEAAWRIENQLQDDELFEIECAHIAELAKISLAETHARLHALRWIETRERQKAQRDRKRLLWCVLVYFCKMNPLAAFGLVMLIDARMEEANPDGMGIV